MDTLSPMILLHENGYKAPSSRTNGGDDFRLVMLELQARLCASEQVTSMSR